MGLVVLPSWCDDGDTPSNDERGGVLDDEVGPDVFPNSTTVLDGGVCTLLLEGLGLGVSDARLPRTEAILEAGLAPPLPIPPNVPSRRPALPRRLRSVLPTLGDGPPTTVGGPFAPPVVMTLRAAVSERTMPLLMVVWEVVAEEVFAVRGREVGARLIAFKRKFKSQMCDCVLVLFAKGFRCQAVFGLGGGEKSMEGKNKLFHELQRCI